MNEGNCWIWEGRISTDGYGMGYDRDTKQYITAHRLVYTKLTGKIPQGMQIDHLCRNRACVNPTHLEPVTQQENIARGNVGNAKKIFCLRGHPLYGENLGINNKGNRWCKSCKATTSRAYNLVRKQPVTN